MNSAPLTLLFLGGVFHLGIAIFHLLFWRIFHRKKDLASLTHVNRAVMQILNLCLTFLVLAMAYMSFVHASELISTPLGRTIAALIALFWMLRLILQVIFFNARHRVSILFILLFLIGASLYIPPLFWSPA